jgi:hypothetical protein
MPKGLGEGLDKTPPVENEKPAKHAGESSFHAGVHIVQTCEINQGMKEE